MTEHVQISTENQIGCITLDRPKALNSLSLEMIRAITAALLAWRADAGIRAVLIRSSSEKAFCAGGDIRFFYDVGTATPRGGSALLEDFFTEEYALNHLIHAYPKPYIALMDGVVMGGGMGVAQAGPGSRLRIVTERTKMAMPEVNIGLFPDVGGGYFLSHCAGQLGTYLGVSGEIIAAADALHAGLADVFVPSAQLPALTALLRSGHELDVRAVVRDFAACLSSPIAPEASMLATHRAAIDRHFAADSVPAIVASLAQDDSPFARKTLAVMQKRSPLMMCVTLEQIRRSAALDVADCLRMERSMVRHCFEHGEVIEGVRALVVDKDNAPQWNPATLAEVTPELVNGFFAPAWPPHAHPLRTLA
ncbi:enoyl-CoA hydratase/isomerase family protein [Herminiimonas sp. CN]|uniref:enoyl-CoA hydratase/isomerase family protein n=1 Tax=Herminiimonas sp. CN TaxID=1349818 RepID=UPI0004743BFB|nr:enoyl-CoA hydratase/isomerase family protein [Herminiimonas sp. CN]